ncbi:MAG: hypothetical protein R3F59_00965 [Myxococcota bacterium]
MKAFWRYVDQNGNQVAGITYNNRNGNGNNPAYLGTSNFPALSHNRIYAHSIRGKQTPTAEGGKECVGCHLTTDMMNTFGADYQALWTAYTLDQDYDFVADNGLYPDLQQFIGQNTNNQLGHPYYVHMQAGLGSFGLMAADANGCPVNPLDTDANRQFCNGVAPADQFDPDNIAYDLDRTVQSTGITNASYTRPFLDLTRGPELRIGAQDPTMSGALGVDLLTKLADPNTYLILDAWIDANGVPQGNANNYVQYSAPY